MNILRMALAFIGTIVGAGFASGQEILQYFTSFGIYGTASAFVATCLFAYIGMMLMRMGSRMQSKSHNKPIYQLSGKYLGYIVDGILIFTLLGVGVVMIAGAGSMLSQQYGLPNWLGSLLMAVFTLVTILLSVNRIITIIGAITPFLIVALVIITIYSLFIPHESLSILDPIARTVKSPLPNWFISAINYVSFNVAVGCGMALLMGGNEKNEKTASWAGFIGGLGIGLLIFVAHFSIFYQIESVKDVHLPLLRIIQNISPILGVAMTIVLFGMIYNTSVSMCYAFVARFTENKSKFYTYIFSLVTIAVVFCLSFVGFTKLVSYFYPLIGYLGLLLIVILMVSPFRVKKNYHS